eukprot:1268047-Karenia_brevis.AAC.1
MSTLGIVEFDPTRKVAIAESFASGQLAYDRLVTASRELLHTEPCGYYLTSAQPAEMPTLASEQASVESWIGKTDDAS